MILKVSTQYKKDLKRYQNKPSKIAALKEVLKHLKKSGAVPAAYKPHMLSCYNLTKGQTLCETL